MVVGKRRLRRLLTSPVAFITDYLHTVVVLLLSIFLSLKAINAPATGGLDTVWRNVTALAQTAPIAGNLEGSYLTMNSLNALAFGTLHTVSSEKTLRLPRIR